MKVMFGCAPFSQTVVVPEMIAEGSVVTTILMLVGTAQVAGAAEVGVNVYTAVPAAEVAILLGAQVPVIPLLEVAGKRSGVAPWQ